MRGLLILLLLYPFLEMYSLFLLADKIGGSWTLLWIITSFFLGTLLMRSSKLGGLLTAVTTLREGKVGLFSLLWPVRLMFAGLLLAIPGLISDVFALLLLLPWPSPKIADINLGGGFNNGARPGNEQADDIIEGEYERVDPRTPNDRHLR
ncbi:FxsA family protein [Vogesella oryzae]|uniref:FxsA family protein n=1 Tax=Vogesella oryzae TaxID=1735285 RepID=UPI0015824644|nr:FxsA family protein [Vogesella oryzae]